MKQLPPDSYIIPNKYLSNYNQQRAGVCSLIASLSQISNRLAIQKDCNIQLSFWEFADCFERYVISKINNSSMTGENFLPPLKKCTIIVKPISGFNNKGNEIPIDTKFRTHWKTTVNKKSIRLENINLVSILPSEHNYGRLIIKNHLTQNRILTNAYDLNFNFFSMGYCYLEITEDLNLNLDSIDFSDKTFPVLIDSKTFIDHYINNTNTKIFKGGQDYLDRFIKVLIYVTDIQEMNISLDTTLKIFSYPKIQQLDLYGVLNGVVKEYQENNSNFEKKFMDLIYTLLSTSGIKFKTICSYFNNNISEISSGMAGTDDCFSSNECEVLVKVDTNDPSKPDPSYVGNVHKGYHLKTIDDMKNILSSNKSIQFDISQLLLGLLSFVRLLNLYIKGYMDKGDILNEAINKAIQSISIGCESEASQCEAAKEILDFYLDCVPHLYKNGIITDTIDLSNIEYFFDILPGNNGSRVPRIIRTPIKCNIKLVAMSYFINNTGHSLIIYGYEKIDDDTTLLYIKNSWGDDNELPINKFKIKINNYTRFNNSYLGDLFSYKDSQITFKMLDNKNPCDCCSDLSSSSSASGSSSSSGGSSSSSTPPEPGQIYACYFDMADDINGEFNAIDILNSSNVYTNNSNRIIYKNGVNQWVIAVWDFGYEGDILYETPIGSSVIASNWTVVYGNGEGGQTLTDPC